MVEEESTDPLVIEDESIEPFTQQAFELWINPEIERRREDGRLAPEDDVVKIQVIFNHKAPIEVRLNNEVKAQGQFRVNRAIAKGELVMAKDISEVVSILLTENDPNAGHITMIYLNEAWHVMFDFRRNGAHVARHIEAAQEFLTSATLSLDAGVLRPFTESMMAAAELMARALLMMHDHEVLNVRTHETIKAKFNRWGHLGNTDARYTKHLNRLGKLRSSARYLNGDFNLSADDARSMLDVAYEMLASVRERAPRRAGVEDGELPVSSPRIGQTINLRWAEASS